MICIKKQVKWRHKWGGDAVKWCCHLNCWVEVRKSGLAEWDQTGGMSHFYRLWASGVGRYRLSIVFVCGQSCWQVAAHTHTCGAPVSCVHETLHQSLSRGQDNLISAAAFLSPSATPSPSPSPSPGHWSDSDVAVVSEELRCKSTSWL